VRKRACSKRRWSRSSGSSAYQGQREASGAMHSYGVNAHLPRSVHAYLYETVVACTYSMQFVNCTCRAVSLRSAAGKRRADGDRACDALVM
jgi:hypothetical protein